MPKRSWFNPPPFDAPIRYPRQIPRVVVPSFIGDSGQVLNLLMHHGAGSVVRDYSGFGNRGTIYGSSWVDGEWGWALSSDGVDDWIRVLHSNSLYNTSNLTIEMFLNVLTLPEAWTGVILKSPYYPYDYGYFIWGDDAQFTVSDSADDLYLLRVDNIVEQNVWIHHTCVLKDSRYMYIYKNGEQVGYKDIGAAITPRQTAGDLHIARWGSQYLNALYGPVRIYSRALTADEIRYHFESTRAIFGV